MRISTLGLAVTLLLATGQQAGAEQRVCTFFNIFTWRLHVIKCPGLIANIDRDGSRPVLRGILVPDVREPKHERRREGPRDVAPSRPEQQTPTTPETEPEAPAPDAAPDHGDTNTTDYAGEDRPDRQESAAGNDNRRGGRDRSK